MLLSVWCLHCNITSTYSHLHILLVGLYQRSRIVMQTSCTTIDVLLVSRDHSETALLIDAMRKLGIVVEVSNETAVLHLLNTRKFEAVVVDFSIAAASTILEQVRSSPSNRNAVTFAIVSPWHQAISTLRARASFLLERPLSPGSVCRTVQAAYGMMVHERRRYFRCPISVSATLQLPGGKLLTGHTVNVSENGLALHLPEGLNPGDKVTVQFRLPQLPTPIDAQAVVRWYREGKAGLLFLSVAPAWRSSLSSWLADRMEASLRHLDQV